tara:strand:+ start:1 stop:3123 length:3123 start_codon:yes stop_codon:yes gene_type:complete
MFKKVLLTGALLSFFSSLSFTQDEQVTVIGSLIKGTPIDTGSPISTFSAEEIGAQGNLNIVELIKMVPGSSGMDGEANQFGSNASEGISNVNLRGLGTNRTLVLINGRRQVTVPIATGAGRSVNLHDLPMAALSRIEILKEGAAATYGSDAIAGVVNFITDSTFEGLRVNVAGKAIANTESDGNEFSITYGTALDDGTNFLLSLGQQKKSELRARNTDYVRRSFKENGVGGWSSFGNPGTFLKRLDDDNAATAAPLAYIGDPGCNAAGGYAQMLSLDGKIDHKDDDGNVISETDLNGYHALCRYQYAYFDNVQEDQTNSQLWMEFNGDVNGEHDFHVEFAYGKTNVPNYATSPSYPPNNPTATVVPNFHPALQALYDQHPNFATLLKGTEFGGNGTTQADAHGMFARPFAVAGNPNGNSGGAEIEYRKYDVVRFGFDFEGSLADGIDYRTGLNYSQSEGDYTFSDTQQNKYNASLWGYGGPNCPYELTALSDEGVPTMTHTSTGAEAVLDGSTPPTGCNYLNIFSNAVEQGNQPYHAQANPFTGDKQVGTSLTDNVGKNPNYLAAHKNDPDFLRWLVDRGQVEAKSTLMTVDFTMQGIMGALAGGDAAWAAGYERREYTLEQSLPVNAGTRLSPTHDIFDGDKHPCLLPKDNRVASARAACLSSNPAGLFMFLAPAYSRDQSQEVDSLFAEFALPILDNFDMQLALRYEDYGNVDSIDPKVVMRWTPIDELTLRFTGQTTFRAPNPDETWDKRSTALAYVAQTSAFKAIDSLGNANLDPEEATTYNIGIITDFGSDNWTATVDYYKFEFDNPIITESYAQIAAAYEAGKGSSPTAAQTAAFNAIKSQVRGGATYATDGSFAASQIARITTPYVNGPATETDGLDLYVKYETDYAEGVLSAGMEAAYVIDYSVGAYSKGGAQIADAYECAGYFNINNTCRSMPDLKSKAFVNYVTDQHNFYGAINYVSSYEDRRSSVEITPHTTVDATYTYSWDDEFSMSFSAYNLTDEQPPFTLWEMSYDPNTHSPLGRFFKVGFTYNMQ